MWFRLAYPASRGDILIVVVIGSHGDVSLEATESALRLEVHCLDTQHMLKFLQVKPETTGRLGTSSMKITYSA